MSHWADDFAWQARYVPIIRRIVGPLLLEEAPAKIDKCEATDLLVLHARDMRIACRVRKPGYADRYGHEFTIRSKRDTGAVTELKKLVNGFGDWMFYGHAAEEILGIERWMIVDLHAWRAHHIRSPELMRMIAKKQHNGDGTHFVAYDVRDFPSDPPILLSQSFEMLQRAQAAIGPSSSTTRIGIRRGSSSTSRYCRARTGCR
jgi:hypothetical protein